MAKILQRARQISRVRRLLKANRIVAILGMRQVGKTTLARQVYDGWPNKGAYFDLESREDIARLEEPVLALEPLKGLVVIDEVQHSPGLFAVLRVLVDRPRSARFLVLGSAAPDLLRQGAETLAGRIAFLELDSLALGEVGADKIDSLWLRGGLPPSCLARTEADSFQWRRDYVRTFVERDLGQLGIGVPSPAMRRFWSMLAHYHGCIWNSSGFARSFGVSDKTIRRYLDLLTGTFVVRQLQPWHANVRKRQVRSPKVYLTDTGLLHCLLGIRNRRDLETNPVLGASWEGFAMESVIAQLGADPEECFFWATHSGAELDLLVLRGSRKIGFEFKRTDAPSLTKSARVAMEDLRLNSLTVVHGGKNDFPLARNARALPARDIPVALRPLG